MSVESFEVTLDSPNGVYYPGEVVEGSVRLTTASVLCSRSISFRFHSHSYMEWSTDSGDDKVTSTGSKIYQYKQYTMFGSIHKTNAHFGVYKNAVFDEHSGEGIMYVPCKEGENVNVVLQVMSRTLFKEEKCIAYAILNLREAVTCQTTHRYPLTCCGSRKTAEITLSAEIVPASTLLPLQSPYTPYTFWCAVRVHQVTGLHTTAFGNKTRLHVQAHRVSVYDYMDAGYAQSVLPGPDDCNLPAGTHVFPFAFTIRDDAPASAELGAGDLSYIRHSIFASIDTQQGWWKDPSTRRTITVLARTPLPPLSMLYPIRFSTTKPVSMSDACSFCCLNFVGHVTAEASLDRQVFAPGEALSLLVRLNNNTKKVLTIRVDLYCHVVLRRSNGDPTGKPFCTTIPVHRSTVDPGRAWDFNGTLMEVRIPAVPPSFFGTESDPVSFTYSLVVYARTPGFWGQAFAFSFPILISAVPPLASHLAAAQHEQRLPVTQLKPICADPHSFAAISRSADSELCAEYALWTAGRLAPCGEPRTVCQIEYQVAVNKDALLYQPVVMVYDRNDRASCLDDKTATRDSLSNRCNHYKVA